jgi:SAM-dependent methyltransferase
MNRRGRVARGYGAAAREHARQYAVSRAHEGATRLMLIEHMEPVPTSGCSTWAAVGADIAFAPYVARAVAFDVAPGAAHGPARGGARRGANVETVCGDAHRLPFRDGAFGLVTSRLCPHHFAEIRLAVAEMARVLAVGGRLGIADGTVPDDPEIDAFVNRIDTLHDPTTVRNYSAREWRGFCEASGLRVDFVDDYAIEIPEGRSLLDWLARSGCSSAVAEECRRMLLEAPSKVRDWLRVRPAGEDVSFELPRVVMVATRAA